MVCAATAKKTWNVKSLRIYMMSILTVPLLGLGETLPASFTFQRYECMLNATLFGAPTAVQPNPKLGIKSFRIFLNRGRTTEGVLPIPPIEEDGIMYPVLPPKRPKP
jgi:hypothetical protein